MAQLGRLLTVPRNRERSYTPLPNPRQAVNPEDQVLGPQELAKFVESRGIEPRSEPCKGPVLPLNYDPVVDMTVTTCLQVRPYFLSLSSR